MNHRQAAAKIRRFGVNWPHLSPQDRVSLESNEPEAMKVLLSTVPNDDEEIVIVTEITEDDEVVSTSKVTNPMPMYKRLGFKDMVELDAAVNKDISELTRL